MTSIPDFQPKYAQPFTLAQAIELEVGVLTTEITRLQNSISHLTSSNIEIQRYIDAEDDELNKKEFEGVVKENEDVISAQSERIDLIHLALRHKLGNEQAAGTIGVGLGSLEHYGFGRGVVEGVLRGGTGGGAGVVNDGTNGDVVADVGRHERGQAGSVGDTEAQIGGRQRDGQAGAGGINITPTGRSAGHGVEEEEEEEEDGVYL